MVDVQGAALCSPILQLQLVGSGLRMSRAAKITLGVSVVACVGTIWGVHYMQRREREVSFYLFIDATTAEAELRAVN